MLPHSLKYPIYLPMCKFTMCVYHKHTYIYIICYCIHAKCVRLNVHECICVCVCVQSICSTVLILITMGKKSFHSSIHCNCMHLLPMLIAPTAAAVVALDVALLLQLLQLIVLYSSSSAACCCCCYCYCYCCCWFVLRQPITICSQAVMDGSIYSYECECIKLFKICL